MKKLEATYLECGCCMKLADGRIICEHKIAFFNLVKGFSRKNNLIKTAFIPVQVNSMLECGCCFQTIYKTYTSQWKSLCDEYREKCPEAALLKAAQLGYTEAITWLIEAGVDPNCYNNNNRFTPLHWAAWNGQYEASCKLIVMGADKKLKEKNGRTPFDIALDLKRIDCLEVLEVLTV